MTDTPMDRLRAVLAFENEPARDQEHRDQQARRRARAIEAAAREVAEAPAPTLWLHYTCDLEGHVSSTTEVWTTAEAAMAAHPAGEPYRQAGDEWTARKAAEPYSRGPWGDGHHYVEPVPLRIPEAGS